MENNKENFSEVEFSWLNNLLDSEYCEIIEQPPHEVIDITSSCSLNIEKNIKIKEEVNGEFYVTPVSIIVYSYVILQLYQIILHL